MNYGVHARRLGVEKLAHVHGMEKEAVIAQLKRGGRALSQFIKRPSQASMPLTQHDWSKAISAHPSRMGASAIQAKPSVGRTLNVTAPPMRPTLAQSAAPIVPVGG